MFFLPKLELLQKTVKTEGKYKGLDTRPGAEENTLSDCFGISASAFPTLSVCNPCIAGYTTGSTDYDVIDPGNDQMLELFGGNPLKITRHYTLRDGTKTMKTFYLAAGDTLISASYFYSDLVLLVRNGNKLLLYRYDQTCTLTETIDMSDVLNVNEKGTLCIVYFTDRLIILQNDKVYISYIRSLNQWADIIPDNLDEMKYLAQQVRISGRHFSCGIFYRSRPVIFDTNEMYQVYNEFTPFSISKTADVGCINPRSLAICNGILCFLSADGVMAYNGTGLPYKISEQLPDIAITAANSSAAALGDCYYLGEYVYCFTTKQWTKLLSLPEGSTVSASYSDDESLWMVVKSKSQSTLYEYSPNQWSPELLAGAWSFTTHEFHEEEPGKKKLTQLAFRVEPYQTADLKVEIAVEGGDWQTIFERQLHQNGAEEIRVKTPPGEHFRLRFSGSGKLSIGYIRRVYQLLSDGKIHPFV